MACRQEVPGTRLTYSSIRGSHLWWQIHRKRIKYNWGCLNSLAPGKFEWNFRHVIFKQISVIDGWGISCEIALIWMSLDFTDDQSTLVQVMAWCRQATSHYLSQCWPRSLSPYGVTRPQWKCQDYFYVKWEYLNTMQKIKNYLRHENKANGE